MPIPQSPIPAPCKGAWDWGDKQGIMDEQRKKNQKRKFNGRTL